MRNKLTVRSFLRCFMLTGALSFGAPVLVCGSTEPAAIETPVRVSGNTETAAIEKPVRVCGNTGTAAIEKPVRVCGSIVAAPGMTPELEKCETEGSRSENEEVYGPPVPKTADNSDTGNVDATGTDLMADEADGKNQSSRQQGGESHTSQKQDEQESNSVFQNSASSGSGAADEADHSGEGQISRPSYEVASGPDAEGFIDDSTDNTYGYYTIMGTTTVTLEDMTSQYEAQGVTYPSETLKDGGAETIEEFCRIILEEASLEGVRAEVVYEQSMLETGWLQFQGDAQAQQYNFAGLGTTGGGVQGNSYPDVRTGIRAQVQHLKAYACTEDLNENCVDTRFDMVRRGSAPYVEWLGIQENPNGGGWAAGANYGSKLRRLLADLKGETYTPEVPEMVEDGQDEAFAESQTEAQGSTAAEDQTAEQKSIAAGNQVAEQRSAAAGNQVAEQGSAAAGNQVAEQGSMAVENQTAGQSEKDTEVQK